VANRARGREPVRASAAVAGALLVWAAASSAAPVTVFGPKTYRRGPGKPVAVVDSFRGTPSARYTLRIQNGGNGQFPKVRNAVVSLNGAQLLGQGDFQQDLIEVPVTLRATNQLSVTIRSEQGTGFVLEITNAAVDTVPPTITASASPPANAAGWNNTDVVVTFTCSDAGSGIAVCPAPVTVTAEGAGQVVTGTAQDRAGNHASASVTLKIDKTPPSISAAAAPPPNADGWNSTDVVVSFQCADALSGVVQCPAPETVSEEASSREISGTVSDRAGNTAAAHATVRLDRTPPTVTITTPANGVTVPASPLTVTGTASDLLSGIGSVSCAGVPALVSGSAFSCSVPLAPGSNTIVVEARDLAANAGSAQVGVGLLPAPINVTITAPAPLALFRSGPVTVEGTLDREVTAVVVNGVLAQLSGQQFSAAGVTLREGNNVLTATATAPGGAVGTGSVTVRMDSTPPTVRIDSPADGAVVTAAQLTVSGMINDIVSGTVNAEQATVTVNGVAASIANRSFVATDVLLARGLNTLAAVARDAAGNESRAEVHVTFRDVAGQQRIEILGGNNQTGVVGTSLNEPLLVGLSDAFGRAVVGRPVTFTVVRTDGVLTAFPDQGRTVTVLTDDRGQASALFQLGTRTGAGNNQVAASAPGFAEVVFSATATVGVPVRITADAVMGESFRGAAGAALSAPFVAMVFDGGGNAVPGVPVTFTVTGGGGHLEGGGTTLTKNTNSDGKADATLTLGPEPGIANNAVTAGFEGLAEQLVTFTASGLDSGPAEQTRFSGVVVDNANTPIPNAHARISGTSLEAFTNVQGQFTIGGVPVGTVLLEVDGSTSTRPETFPMLAFHITTVAGQDNSVGMPIYLPPLDTVNSRIVGGDDSVDLTMAGVPGVLFTVFPHSATFKDGSRVGRVTLTQVHADKVPMPPPFGTAPRIVWTIQPHGTRFDPPVRVQLPNTDGMTPGQVIEVFQFDHDLEQFVSVGPARVTPDGSVVVTDPGFGITKAGWGGAPPPPPPKQCTCSCDDGNECTQDNCSGQPNCACSHQPLTNGSCCKGVKIDPATQGCCNGKIYTKATQCCVKDKVVPKNADGGSPLPKPEDCPDRTQNSRPHEYDGCSVPGWLPVSDGNNPAGGRDTQFSNAACRGTTGGGACTGACDLHDTCYQTCSTDDNARLHCDQLLRDTAIATCNASTEPPAVRDRCRTWAGRYYDGLRLGGGGAFKERQQQYCKCCS
jgi:hypothetical protein